MIVEKNDGIQKAGNALQNKAAFQIAMITTKLSQKCSISINRSSLVNVLINRIYFISIAFLARAFIYGVLFLDRHSKRNNSEEPYLFYKNNLFTQ